MKSKIIKCLIAMLFAISIKAQPPNNAIFFGGAGDGFIIAANTSASNNIFLGGSGDGGSVATNGVTSNNIFLGSTGQGFNNASNNAVSNTIFIGGIGDGFNNAGNSAVSNNIFLGGNSDGWHFAANTSASNNIFLGGVGDGWSSDYLPLGPLPITLLNFSGQQVNKQHLLSWQTSQESNSSYFELQRAATANNFNGIGTIAAAGFSTAAKQYSFIDAAPMQGNNLYRLKQVDNNGKFVYSNVVVLRWLIDKSVLSIYPNPTASLLQIKFAGATDGSTVKVDLFDMAGKLVSSSLLKKDNVVASINVSTYAKGVYTLRITDNEQVSSLKFIKN
jgi:Secretion system C-terminal sorting domain